jgi:hypothetical protein
MRIAKIAVAVLALASMALAQGDKAKRPSPPGQAEVTLNGKKITIDYSRPKVQDPKTGEKRKMIGEHDPYGKPWRVGANEATTFVTEGDVEVGGTTVPAGKYTLYALPEPGKWTLIISKKTGQWGIPYPGEQEDFARIPMTAGKSSPPLDQFTISFENVKGNQADLVLAWEDWKASVAVKAK